jgi:hypothetical protein
MRFRSERTERVSWPGSSFGGVVSLRASQVGDSEEKLTATLSVGYGLLRWAYG